MATEQNLSEHLEALPVERQREVISLLQENIDKIRWELVMLAADLSEALEDKERLAVRLDSLVTERSTIVLKYTAMLEAMAAVDPTTAEKLGYLESEEPETLLAHRGSIVVSAEQDFSAIRKNVIAGQVREENL